MKKYMLPYIITLILTTNVSLTMEHAYDDLIRNNYAKFYNANSKHPLRYIRQTIDLCKKQKKEMNELSNQYEIALKQYETALKIALIFNKEESFKTLLEIRASMSSEFQKRTAPAIHKTYVQSLDFFGNFAHLLLSLDEEAIQINLQDKVTGLTPLHTMIWRYNAAHISSITNERAEKWRGVQIERIQELIRLPHLDLTILADNKTPLQAAGVTRIGFMIRDVLIERSIATPCEGPTYKILLTAK